MAHTKTYSQLHAEIMNATKLTYAEANDAVGEFAQAYRENFNIPVFSMWEAAELLADALASRQRDTEEYQFAVDWIADYLLK